jgi:hypothetical protein
VETDSRSVHECPTMVRPNIFVTLDAGMLLLSKNKMITKLDTDKRVTVK